MSYRLLFLSLLMLGIACQQLPVPTVEPQVSVTPRPTSEVKIPFTTVESDQLVGNDKRYESKTPGFIVVADATNLNSVQRYISAEAFTQLTNLDFATHFAVIVFQGLKTSTGYDILVQDIRRDGNDIFIYARLEELAPNILRGAAMTSPYSLVIAEKEGVQQQGLRYHLIGNGIEIATFSD